MSMIKIDSYKYFPRSGADWAPFLTFHHVLTLTMLVNYASLPLTARPLDFFYFIFFLASLSLFFYTFNSHDLNSSLKQSHIPATLMLDLHALFRAPDYLRVPVEWYIGMSRDPLVGVASGAFGDSSARAHLGWFKSFLVLELCGPFFHLHRKTQLNPTCSRVFQLPVFFLGIRGLYKGF